MKQINIMIKPASSLCNMRCRYCFYNDISSLRKQASYGVMPAPTRKALIENVCSELLPGDEVTFAFQGGEPTLAGLKWFRDFVTEEKSLCPEGFSVSYAFQTNGLLLDDSWLEFFLENNFLVGLSIDGPRDMHDGFRPDASGKGTFSHIIDVKSRMDYMRIQYNILCVLTNNSARHPKKLWRFITEQGIKFIQFIPCLAPLGQTPDMYALTPGRYASFYMDIFDIWYRAFRAGKYISIKLFDDLINLLACNMENACGICGRCSGQIVVEADGSVYPCDFYAVDEWLVGNLAHDRLSFLYNSPVQTAFRSRNRSLPDQCAGCRFFSICGGGCPRMKQSVFCSASDGSCGHRTFLEYALPRLIDIADNTGKRF